MANRVTVIQPTLTLFSSKPIENKTKRRVAGYARVSTDKDEQYTSYEAQVEYYKRFIKSNDQWEFVDVYTDEGISGTHTANRDGFNRMIADALSGKIDLILTKSVSRFARNTVDSLTKIRELKDNGVEVFFEKENIWTFEGSGELLLTIMSSLAQEESRSISENIRWGWQRSFEEGKVSLAYSKFLGYDKNPEGGLKLNPQQAPIVRRIYDQFLSGRSINSITTELNILGPKKPFGDGIWTNNNIKSILTNEKYTGNAILQKSYKTDLLSKRKVNNGEVKKYYVADAHEAIVSQEEFDIVQEELKRRSAKYSNKTLCKSVFSDRVLCGDCGHIFGAKLWHSTDKYRTTVWQCNNKFKAEKRCTTPHLTENALKETFMKAVNMIAVDRESVKEDLTHIRDVILATASLETELNDAKKLAEDSSFVVRNLVGGAPITDTDRLERLLADCQKKADKFDELQEKLRDLNMRRASITRFIEKIDSLDPFYQEFSDSLFRGMCDCMIVHSKAKIIVRFHSGYEVEINSN